MLKKLLPWLAAMAILVTIANVVWAVAELVTVGSALNGYQADGHYFVAHPPGYVEVTQATWDWLRFHTATLFMVFPVGMVSLAYLVLRFRLFPDLTGGTVSGEQSLASVERIRASGPPIASGHPGVRLGSGLLGMRISSGIADVSVHPDGIIIGSSPMREHAILASEITGLRENRRPFRRLVVSHSGVDSKSPLVLTFVLDDDIARAIAGIAPAAEGSRMPEESGEHDRVSQ